MPVAVVAEEKHRERISFPISSFNQMEAMHQSSASLPSNYDELSMQQSLHFSDSLKDLKSLRSQLYAAAEYFEFSYTHDDQKNLLLNTLKDYAVKALVNTVDHLGSMSYKVNGLLNEKFDEVSGSEFLLSCIEQRLQTCQEDIDQQGHHQQSLMITAPKYHKHYILPVGGTMLVAGKHAVPQHLESNQITEDIESIKLQSAVHSTISDKASSFRKLRSVSPSPRARSSSPSQKGRYQPPSQIPGKFSFKEKRAVSPLPSSNTLTLSHKPVVSSLSNNGRQHPSQPHRSASMRLHAERNDEKEMEQNSTKSKSILKALLSRRRSKKDETLYNYLDEY